MKLGIIGAMEVEVASLQEAMEEKTDRSICGMTFCTGKLCGLDAVVVQCGVGKVNAALCAQILVSNFGVSHIINTGIAGSLCNDLDIGDIVVSQDAQYHDLDVQVFGYPIGKVPGLDVVQFPASEELIAYAFAASEQVNPGHTKIGRVASGDQFVCTQEQKDKIIADTKAICTEMEGTAIAHAAYRNNIPFVIIRAISDKADNSSHVEYPVFEAQAARHCAGIVMAFAERLRDSLEI